MNPISLGVSVVGDKQSTPFVRSSPLVKEAVHRTSEYSEKEPMTSPMRKVLVVDDNRDSANSLAMLLRLMGNSVQTAHDGIQAVERAGEFRPDVIFMDLGMPKLNGLEATRKIREQPWGKTITVVALTGWGQESDRQRTKEAGCDNHLVKPIAPAVLEQVLSSLNGPPADDNRK